MAAAERRALLDEYVAALPPGEREQARANMNAAAAAASSADAPLERNFKEFIQSSLFF